VPRPPRVDPHCRTTFSRRARSILIALLATTAPIAWADPDAGASRADLQARLDQILTDHKQPKIRFGGRVISLPDGEVLYHHRADRPLIPASNLKLIVMAAAIDRLGADYRFTTVLAIRGTDLVVIGGGDPTFGDVELARDRGETMTTVFHDWAARLKEAGVHRVPGNIVIDDHCFDHDFTHERWPADQFQAWYEAPIGGLNFNANCVEVWAEPGKGGGRARVWLSPGNTLLPVENKTATGKKQTATMGRLRHSDTITVSGTVARRGKLGDVTIRDPGLYFGYVLKTVLAAKGIAVGGRVVRDRIHMDGGRLPADCHPVAVHHAPLADALARSGKKSLGMMTEGLIKTLGREHRGIGSWPAGREAVAAFLTDVGIPRDTYVIDDGSGLSRDNRLTPHAVTEVLRHMFRSGDATFDLLRDSLAVGGIDGTLRKRFRNNAARGHVYGKTGYINGVKTLAGYVQTRSGQWLAFAFFYNNAKATRPLNILQDRACEAVYGWPAVTLSD